MSEGVTMEEEESPRLRWYQCLICGKMLDSEDAERQHERKCREREALLYSLRASFPLDDENSTIR